MTDRTSCSDPLSQGERATHAARILADVITHTATHCGFSCCDHAAGVCIRCWLAIAHVLSGADGHGSLPGRCCPCRHCCCGGNIVGLQNARAVLLQPFAQVSEVVVILAHTAA